MTFEDHSLQKTSDIIPISSHEVEFMQWVKAARDPSGARTQHPVDELLAEHYIMDSVLAAMEREARRLVVHRQLRPDYWEDVVDYVGNYVHQIHRRKEEQGLFPKLVNRTVDVMQIAKEHVQARNLTVDLLEGVSQGDWERVLRAAHVYLQVAKEHLPREESQAFEPARTLLDAAQTAEVRAKFNELEAFGLGDRTRLYYLELAQRLCQRAGLEDKLGA